MSMQAIKEAATPTVLTQAQEILDSVISKPVSLKVEANSIPGKFKEAGFKNFIINKQNRDAYNMCLSFALGKTKKKSLILCGNRGTGKTHLAVAIIKNIPPVEKEVRIRSKVWRGESAEKFEKAFFAARSQFLVADESFQELNDVARNSESKKNLIEKYLNENDVLLLDELRTQNWTAAKQENLYLLVNRAYLNNKRIIITTNFTKQEFEKIDASITDRLVEMADWILFAGESFRK